MTTLSLRAGLLLGTAVVFGGFALPALAQQQAAQSRPAQQQYDLPAQPLGSALESFARLSGWQVGYPAALTAGKAAPALEGRLAPAEALSRLLGGSGLTYRMTGPGTVTLVEAPQGSDATVLPTISVEGQSRRAETAYGPVEGYVAGRSATATKTDTPLIETPASVQVIPRDVIEEQGAQRLKDVYDNASGVQQAGNTLNAQTEVLPIIRGFESPVLLRNGLRTTQAGAVDLVNVERVEVLKGPASILYGALQPGGVVSYVTKRPQDTASHTVEQQVGSYSHFRTEIDSTGRVTEDGALLYRTSLAYTDSESFRREIEPERLALAPSFLWQSDRTELLVDFSYLHEKQQYDTGIPLDASGQPLASDRTFFGDPDLGGRDIRDYTASYQLRHEISSVWTLRNQLQLHRAEAKNESIRPRGITGAAGSESLRLRYQNEDRRDDEVQLVLDATAEFATGAVDHTLLLGADAITQDSDFRRFRQNIADVVISDDPAVDFTPPASQTKQVILGSTDWAGFYVQDQLSLLEDGRLKLLFGGRYDLVRQTSENNGVDAANVHDRAFTGRTGLLYQVTPQYAAYASISQSFLPQSTGTLDASGQPLDPEKGLQYETGIKGSFLGDRLLATASVFQIEKKNVAVFDQARFNATNESTYLPGVRQRSRGFEFDLAGNLTEQVKLIANYSYVDTETLANPADASEVGEPLGGVPMHKARLWLTYAFEELSPLGGLSFGGGVRYVGTSTTQFDNAVELDPYAVFDAGVWYRWQSVKAGLNIYNLFDKRYIARASDRSIAHPGEPLSVLASVSIRF